MIENRPGITNRPGVVNRPNINIGNSVNVNRPTIGINNRPVGGWGIDPGYSRPNWGGYWNSNCIHHHHGWYHGCWNNGWGHNWYVPMVWGAAAWTWGARATTWGYGFAYSNPYYVVSDVSPYDYSQPIVVNNYLPSEGEASSPPPDTPETQAALTRFDQSLAQFKQGDYPRALSEVNEALKSNPSDPVMHEFRALTLFALGQYKDAAATLNPLLASAPGMDWTTMSSLYGNPDDYSTQLRRLEAFVKGNTNDAPSRFLLAYHYLVLGHDEQAISALKRVVALEPGDATAARMLESLSSEEKTPAESTVADQPQTDLVGSWKGSAGATTIDLVIDEEFNFTWTATTKAQPPKVLQGELTIDEDIMALVTKESGTMAGKVASGGPDKFSFKIQGTPPTDPGLTFERVK